MSYRAAPSELDFRTLIAAMDCGGVERQIVAADLVTLTEGSAWAQEQVARRIDVPARLSAQDSPSDCEYRGLYELWVRYAEARPRPLTGADLVVEFCAVTDLCMLGNSQSGLLDLKAPPDFVGERFNRLLTVAHELDAHKFGSFEEFQLNLSSGAGLELPSVVIETGRRRLLRILCHSLRSFMRFDVGTQDSWIERLRSSAQQPVDYRPVLEEIQHVMRINQQLPIGTQVLATMFNALVLRSTVPGAFALPQRNWKQLEGKFHIPIVHMRGRYYSAGSGIEAGVPLPVWQGMLRQDIIALASLRPLVMGVYGCGFLEQGAQCLYVARGLGCPNAKNPPEDIVKLRVQTRLANWCHFTRSSLLLDLMDKDWRAYWHDRRQGRPIGTGHTLAVRD